MLIVDDHQLLAQTLALALRSDGVDAAVADLDGREALVARVQADTPALVLLDLELGGAIGDGSTLVRPFVSAGSRVLVVTGTDDPVKRGSVLEHGAVGLLHKAESFERLRDQTLRAARGERVMNEMQRAAVLEAAHRARKERDDVRRPFTRLTPREQQVLHALGRGKPVGHIAREWVISEATVRSQVRSILSKLGVGSQLEAVALAMRAGWFDAD